MRRTIYLAGLLFAVMAPMSVAAGRSSHTFEGHTFSVEIPEGYSVQTDASPKAGMGTFGFTTQPRSDGTRGMIQVTLLDFSKAPPGETITLERFAAAMIGAVQRRRTRWEQTESEVQVGGGAATRIAWSGSVETGFGRPPVHARGVMIVGITKDLGFVLHTQDVMPLADTTLPLGEQALRTFRLTVKR
jgi:hypothetical protein